MSDFEGSDMELPMSDTVKSAIIWAIVSIILTIVLLTVNNDPMVLRASFWAKTGAFLLGAPFGLIGAMTGDAIRKFAAPDMYFTNGGMSSLIWKKVFWAIGPQTVGCVIGCALGPAIVLG